MKATCMDGPLKNQVVDLERYGPDGIHGGMFISIPEPLKAVACTPFSHAPQEESIDLKFHTYMMRVDYSSTGRIKGVTLWAEK